MTRALGTAAATLIVMWVSAYVWMYAGGTYHVLGREKAFGGLKAAVLDVTMPSRWRIDEEKLMIRSLFVGSWIVASGISLLWARVLLRGTLRPGAKGVWRTLVGFVMVGSQSWAILMALPTVAGVILMPEGWFSQLVLPLVMTVVVMLATVGQAAEAAWHIHGWVQPGAPTVKLPAQ